MDHHNVKNEFISEINIVEILLDICSNEFTVKNIDLS